MIVTKDSVAILYLATMGRTISSAGLDYWTNTGDYDGQEGRPLGTDITTMEGLSASFAEQNEYAKLYPTGTTDEVFVNQIFQNLFQRDASSTYWANEISVGNTTRAEAVMSIISGAKDNDAKILENRATVAIDLAENLNLSSETAQSQDVTERLLAITADNATVNTQEDILKVIVPTTNIVDTIGTVSNSSTYGVSSLTAGSYWDLTIDREITYSFNTSLPSSYANYDAKGTLTSNWTELNREQKETVVSIFNEVEKLLNVSFVEVSDTQAQSDGDIQLNIIDMDDNVAGFSFYPGSYYSHQGDIFLSSNFNKNPDTYSLNSGELGWLTIVHELGHALGLEHPFDSDNSTILPTEYDDMNHTVMSYNNQNMILTFSNNQNNQLSYTAKHLYPELYSLYDVATLQSIYGVNSGTNLGDTTYQYSFKDYSINTIWDAGGIDTIDLSSSIGSSYIDLHDGTLNSVDQYTKEEIIQMHQNSVGDARYNNWIRDIINNIERQYGLYTGENNLGIATGTVIENVKTGSGDDIITDNEVNNHIDTGAGNDIIYVGNGGYDRVIGGEGSDELNINMLRSEVTVNAYDGYYLLYTDDYGVMFEGIEEIVFSDGFSSSPELL